MCCDATHAFPPKKDDRVVFKFRSTDYSSLSNFSAHPVEVEFAGPAFGRFATQATFHTGEHAYHYGKFVAAAAVADARGDDRRVTALRGHAGKILRSRSQGKSAKGLGGKGARGLRLTDEELSAWSDAAACGVQGQICAYKAARYADVRAALELSGDRYLLHTAGGDLRWGGVARGTRLDGQNLLGKCWMHTRDHLRSGALVPVAEPEAVAKPGPPPLLVGPNGPAAPRVVCVKAPALRAAGHDSIEDWLADPDHVYVGRRVRLFIHDGAGGKRAFFTPLSKWHNPFKLQGPSKPAAPNARATTASVLDAYRAHVLRRIKEEPRKYALAELRGKVLGCWCKPKACHADVLKELVDAEFGDDPRPSRAKKKKKQRRGGIWRFVRQASDEYYRPGADDVARARATQEFRDGLREARRVSPVRRMKPRAPGGVQGS